MSDMLELNGAGVMPEDIPELEYDYDGEAWLIEELLEGNLKEGLSVESE